MGTSWDAYPREELVEDTHRATSVRKARDVLVAPMPAPPEGRGVQHVLERSPREELANAADRVHGDRTLLKPGVERPWGANSRDELAGDADRVHDERTPLDCQGVQVRPGTQNCARARWCRPC